MLHQQTVALHLVSDPRACCDVHLLQLPGKPQPLDRDVVGRASGFGPEQRYKRSWQEAVAGFFLTSVEARNRLAQVVS